MSIGLYKGVSAGLILGLSLFISENLYPIQGLLHSAIFPGLCLGLLLVSILDFSKLRSIWSGSIIPHVVFVIGFAMQASTHGAVVPVDQSVFSSILIVISYMLITGIPVGLLLRDSQQWHIDGWSVLGLSLAGALTLVAGETLSPAAMLGAGILLSVGSNLVAWKSKQAVEKPSSKGKSDFLVTFSVAAIGLCVFIGMYWFLASWQILAEMQSSTYESTLLAMIPTLFALAGGMALARMINNRTAVVTSTLLLPATMFLAPFLYGNIIYPTAYTSLYSSSLALFDKIFVALFFLIPPIAFASYLIITTLRVLAPAAVRTSSIIAFSAFAGSCLFFFVPDLPILIIASGAVVASMLLLLPLSVSKKKAKWRNRSIVVLPLAAIALIDLPETKISYFDPVRFSLVADEVLPGGRLTVLQSRDYDDPFFAYMWNQTEALTQNSRAAHPSLFRTIHIPLLRHRDPKDLLLIGMGSGTALDAARMHSGVSVTCVEPFQDLITASNAAARKSRTAYTTRGIRLFSERLIPFLKRDETSYDLVIYPEPFTTPTMDHYSFTPEFYSEIKSRLKSDGLFAQWLTLARTDDATIRRSIKGITEAFPHVEMWLSDANPETMMIGVLASPSPFPSGQIMEQRFASFAGDTTAFHLGTIGINAFTDIADEFAMDDAALRAFAEGDVFSPWFSRFVRDEISTNLEERAAKFMQMRTPPTTLLAGIQDSIAVRISDGFKDRQTVLHASLANARGQDSVAVAMLFAVNRIRPWNMEVRKALADLLVARAARYINDGAYQPAITILGEVLRIVPINTFVLRLLMIASLQEGDKETAGLCIDGIRKINPRHAGMRDNQATIRAQQGAIDDALLLYENAITLDPTNEDFYCNMASVQYQVGRAWEAVRILDHATTRASYPARAYYLKGLFYAEKGRLELAREAFEGFLKTAMPNHPQRNEVEERLMKLPKKGR